MWEYCFLYSSFPETEGTKQTLRNKLWSVPTTTSPAITKLISLSYTHTHTPVTLIMMANLPAGKKKLPPQKGIENLPPPSPTTRLTMLSKSSRPVRVLRRHQKGFNQPGATQHWHNPDGSVSNNQQNRRCGFPVDWKDQTHREGSSFILSPAEISTEWFPKPFATTTRSLSGVGETATRDDQKHDCSLKLFDEVTIIAATRWQPSTSKIRPLPVTVTFLELWNWPTRSTIPSHHGGSPS